MLLIDRVRASDLFSWTDLFCGAGGCRLRDRLDTEHRLIADAIERGWAREAERHQRVAARVQHLLDELEPRAD